MSGKKKIRTDNDSEKRGVRKKKDPIDRWLEENTGMYGKDEKKEDEGIDKPEKEG